MKIEFLTDKTYLDCNSEYPEPIKNNIPDWFKKLDHTLNNATIKGCMPFLDSLTAGYLLRTPQDVHIKSDINEKGQNYTEVRFALAPKKPFLGGINLNGDYPEVHPEAQAKGSPFFNQGRDKIINKYLNPWIIKTPPGYSCLFVPPLNNKDERFEIISGIVDTDTFDREINFPFLVNKNKEGKIDTVIERGTPYVQVIPFKRDSWTMSVGDANKYNKFTTLLKESLFLIRNYQKLFWRKKSWK